MKMYETLNIALSCLAFTNGIEDPNFSRIKFDGFAGIKKECHNDFVLSIHTIISQNKKLKEKFSNKILFEFIEEKIFNKFKINEKFQENDEKTFFNELEIIKPRSSYIIAPISGIRLDNSEKVQISIFEIGMAKNLKGLNGNNYEYYISVKINNFYDNNIAIDRAKNLFLDFIRLIAFISGIENKKIAIKIGLPIYPNISHHQIYVDTDSFSVSDNLNDDFFGSSISNKYIEKIPVDNDFFSNNQDFNKLWQFIEQNHNNQKLTDMQLRLLNCSLSVGESFLNLSIKDSILYTSIALETLFSLEERELFQRSIGENISDGFAYLIGKDLGSRLEVVRLVKKFYALRSAIVHGGKASINNDYLTINQYLRSCVKTFLNDEELSKIKHLQGFREILQKARYSY